MKILVTAGSTEVPIDKVRSLGNVFKGKTGTRIAEYFIIHGHEVTLLTSSPHLVDPQYEVGPIIIPFRTFDELHRLMRREIRSGKYDAVIHSSAVSDYRVAEALVLRDGALQPIASHGKISGSHPELYLRLKPTIKLIDQIREPWSFKGTLVKFKLQVGISNRALLAIARKSRADSRADLIVANCLEWCRDRAYIVDAHGRATNVKRDNLPRALYRRIVS